ncbi:MAG TPA: carbohydrate kinase [Balneolales bacterium]|nr:carbohydrate kinase [Balneolales bacterium]
MSRCSKVKIICIGEILWDSLPTGLFLGGAPLNVSLNLRNFTDEVAIISRVGNDRLGDEAIARIKNRNVTTDLIQRDENLETGFVEVTLDDSGSPDYHIVDAVAWDQIEVSNPLLEHFNKAWAIVFGSLAQRSETSRKTIQTLMQSACLRVFDINLRPPFIDPDIIEESLHYTDILKINKDELTQLGEWFDLPGEIEEAVAQLSADFDIPIITVTCGDEGAALLYHSEWFEHPGFKINVADAVGAGDAFLSALLYGIQKGEHGDDILALANATGAYVASHNGAAPEYDIDEIEKMMDRRLTIDDGRKST